jgi:competence protein ComEA
MKLLRNLLAVWLLCMPLAAMSEAVININTVDSETMVEDLVGVGPQKAMAIVRYRQQHGPFQQVDDLALVDGIGAKTVEQNRPRMTVAVPKASQ